MRKLVAFEKEAFEILRQRSKDRRKIREHTNVAALSSRRASHAPTGRTVVNFGVLPLSFVDASDYESLKSGDKITISGFADALAHGEEIEASVGNPGDGKMIKLKHDLSKRQIDVLRAGGIINQFSDQATRH